MGAGYLASRRAAQGRGRDWARLGGLREVRAGQKERVHTFAHSAERGTGPYLLRSGGPSPGVLG